MMSNGAIETGDRLAIEMQCTALVAQFAFMVDHRRYEELAALFTSDGVFERPGKKAEGTAAIIAFMRERPTGVKSRHVCSLPVFEMIDRTQAQSVTYVTMFHGEGDDSSAVNVPGVAGVVEFVDHFRCEDGLWRIFHHESRVAMIVAH